jgi:hypothetical protein
MISIVFTWDQSQVKTIEIITPGSVDTIPGKNNRNHNSSRAWSYGFYCFYLGLYLQSLELWFLLFLPAIVSTEPGVMISIVFTWDLETITPGSRYNPRYKQ